MNKVSKITQPTKFDDWEDVKDCNGCEYYWNDTCDSVPVGSKMHCNSFSAIRGVDIPQQVKTLQNANKRLMRATLLLSICVSAVGLTLLIHLVRGC